MSSDKELYPKYVPSGYPLNFEYSQFFGFLYARIILCFRTDTFFITLFLFVIRLYYCKSRAKLISILTPIIIVPFHFFISEHIAKWVICNWSAHFIITDDINP